MVILLAWLGNADLRAAETGDSEGQGPILGALKAFAFDALHLLSDHSAQRTRAYVQWVGGQSSVPLTSHQAKLTSPTSFEEIFRAAVDVIDEIKRASPSGDLTFHLSPGTPAMAAIWLLIAKTRYPAKLIESSREHGVKEVSIPFELSAEFVPVVDKQADEALTRLMMGVPPESPAFTAIVHRCAAMKRTVAMAHRLAVRDVPVLIQGESGTGKELFARAIHQASTRYGKPFVAVNCGAIPQELVDAELFGHEKGAFTGATAARAGYFESADGGTLFLDEIGELPLASQVRLLRVLQEREVSPVPLRCDAHRPHGHILANPPFAGQLPKDSIRADLPTNSKKSELLFLSLMMQHLAPGGRCAVVVPEGLLFGSTGAHVELRKKLVLDFDLLAVVSLPAGVFKPYAGVKTAVLVFRRPASETAKRLDKVWFYEIRNDGYDPDKVSGGGRVETPEKNDIPDLLMQWKAYKASGFASAPGLEANTLLAHGTFEPSCWWTTHDKLAEADFIRQFQIRHSGRWLQGSRARPRGERRYQI